MQYKIIVITILIGGLGILMFWLGKKQGVNEGRQQILEENIKRESLKVTIMKNSNSVDVITNVLEGRDVLLRGTQC